MIKIERNLAVDRCYFCHRSHDDSYQVLNSEQIRDEVKRYISRGKSHFHQLMKTYRKHLMKLIMETKDYPDLSIEEIEKDFHNLKSMMPRLEELLKYKNSGEKSSKSFLSRKSEDKLQTVAQLREKIEMIYDQIVEDKIPEELNYIDEILYKRLKNVKIYPNLTNSAFMLPKSLKFTTVPLVIYTDLNGEHLREAVNRKYYYDYNFDGNRLLEDAIPVSKANIIEITLKISLCCICNNINKILKGRPL